METNIDDCSGEVLGFVMERLMKAGARDVHYVPVFMKKNRPAWVLNVICKEEDMETLQNIILKKLLRLEFVIAEWNVRFFPEKREPFRLHGEKFR